MGRGPTHPPLPQPGKTGSWRARRCITSPSTCSKASRATTSGSSGPCRGWAASRPSTRPGGPSRGLKRCCGCARASALRARGPSASRTGCSRSASVFQRLTKCETGVGHSPSCGLRQSLRHAPLGRTDELAARGGLASLLASGARYCEQVLLLSTLQADLEGPRMLAKRIGASLLFERLWEETGCRAVIEDLLAERRFEFPVERAVVNGHRTLRDYGLSKFPSRRVCERR